MIVGFLGAFDPSYARNSIILDGLKEQNITIIGASSRFPPHTYSKLLRLLPTVARDFWKLRHADIIFVPCFNQRLAPFIWLLGKLFGKPVLLDYLVGLTDLFEDRYSSVNRLKHGLAIRIDRFNIKHIPTLTDTIQHRQYFAKLLSMPTDQMSILPVGVAAIYEPMALKETEKHHVLFVGKFIPFQGVDIIVKAAEILQSRKDINFKLIGSGQTFESSQQLVQSLGLPNISLLGTIHPPAIFEHFSTAIIHLGAFGKTEKTAYVVPTKIFVGMAVQRVVISGESDAVDELFEAGKHLITIPTGNPEALAQAIVDVVDNPDQAKQMAENASRYIQENFTISHIGLKLKQIIDDTLAKKAS